MPWPHSGRLVTPTELKQAQAIIFQNGYWHKYNQFLHLICGNNEARVLNFLLDWQRTGGKYNLWFFCHDHDMHLNLIGMSPSTINRGIRGLKEKGYLEVRKEGNQRMFKFGYRSIWEDLYPAYQDWAKEKQHIYERLGKR